ncbi:TetR/AcrR family transcriptional regulator [Streptomyces sp. SBC-4]|nr:TetR/AcrR family transcriptional regulator [Streptomyces sp. SBC-4]MDV5144047.1 TetR/AcrR family transcriptional regulator [Streptomyces sp. SBC-4]
MSELTTPRRRRRRTDADRSAAAILRAATEVLAAQPHASVEEIAAVAGVSRQTVYAHFKSREVLVSTVIDAITSEAVSEMDAAALDEGPAAEALLRLLDASWRTLQRFPLLLSTPTPAAGTEADDTRHEAVLDHLDQVLKRGQECGEFARDLPTTWLATSIVALGHAAGGEVATGRMSRPDASGALARSTLRMCGADPSTIDDLVNRRGGT